MKIKNKILWIFVLALILRLIFIDTSYFFWDETVYIMNSQYLVTGHAPYVQLYERPLLLSTIISPFIENEILLRVFMIVLNCLAVFAVYFLGKNFNEKTGLISAFLVAIFPFHIMASRWVMTDSLSFLLISLCVGFYIEGIMKKKLWSYIFGGVFLGLSLLMKFTNILLIGVLLLLFVFFKPNFRKLSYSLLISFIVFSPFLIFSHLHFGNAFFIIKQALHVVHENQPISFLLVFLEIILFFGLLLIFAFIEGFKGKNKLRWFMFSWLLFSLAYFILLSQKGIVKPPGIEWEIQRFLFPAMAPGLVLGGLFLSRMKKITSLILIVLVIVSFIPMYMIAYTPAIYFEDGLREVTKDIGIYARNIDGDIYATVNFPPIGYYSEKKISNKLEDLNGNNIYRIDIKRKEIGVDDNVLYSIEKGDYRAVLTSFP